MVEYHLTCLAMGERPTRHRTTTIITNITPCSNNHNLSQSRLHGLFSNDVIDV